MYGVMTSVRKTTRRGAWTVVGLVMGGAVMPWLTKDPAMVFQASGSAISSQPADGRIGAVGRLMLPASRLGPAAEQLCTEELMKLLRVLLAIELRHDLAASLLAHSPPCGGIGRQAMQRRCQGVRTPRRHQQAAPLVVHELGNAHDPRGHHRQLHRHCLHEHDGDALTEARKTEYVCAGVVVGKDALSHISVEEHPRPHPELGSELFQVSPFGTIAHDGELDIHTLVHERGDGLEKNRVALDRMQPSHSEEPEAARGLILLWARFEPGDVDTAADEVDLRPMGVLHERHQPAAAEVAYASHESRPA